MLRRLQAIHPNLTQIMKSATILLTFFLTASLSQAAVIGSWTQDETSGNLIDAARNHPKGIATGTPTYSTAGRSQWQLRVHCRDQCGLNLHRPRPIKCG